MGVYPEKKFISTPTGYIEEIATPGVVVRRELTAGPWNEERTDCFCCSCYDRGGIVSTDPSCRNHGWWGRRPCEFHQMPGQLTDDGEMPVSIQIHRAA